MKHMVFKVLHCLHLLLCQHRTTSRALITQSRFAANLASVRQNGNGYDGAEGEGNNGHAEVASGYDEAAVGVVLVIVGDENLIVLLEGIVVTAVVLRPVARDTSYAPHDRSDRPRHACVCVGVPNKRAGGYDERGVVVSGGANNMKATCSHTHTYTYQDRGRR